MTIPELIQAIGEKHKNDKFVLHPPVSERELSDFEKKIGFPLPADFKAFYRFCNGFEMETDDIFKMDMIEDILRHPNLKKDKSFHFADYMIYCDLWTLKYYGVGNCKIIHKETGSDIILTDSLAEFLTRYLKGEVFDEGGLIDWHDEVRGLRR